MSGRKSVARYGGGGGGSRSNSTQVARYNQGYGEVSRYNNTNVERYNTGSARVTESTKNSVTHYEGPRSSNTQYSQRTTTSVNYGGGDRSRTSEVKNYTERYNYTKAGIRETHTATSNVYERNYSGGKESDRSSYSTHRQTSRFHPNDGNQITYNPNFEGRQKQLRY